MVAAYVYKADLLCSECGEGIVIDFKSHKVRDTENSDQFPQGPYNDGGGESDSPQHCDRCQRFLENPLTPHGVEYVKEAVDTYNSTFLGNPGVLQEWLDFYGIDAEIKERAVA